jgi:phosphatidylglycerol:prolipoprotein diacylglycerol transferase
MPSDLGQIGPITLRTYTFLLDAAILLGLGVLTWQGWRLDDEPVRWLDAGLLAVAGGVIAGRLAHVAIHWEYFSEHLPEIPAFWEGGINWHAAILAGLLILLWACLRRGVSFRDATDVLAIILPIAAALACVGCLASGCGHGREVASLGDYPPYVAAELPDLYGIIAPRFQTQLFEITLNVILLILAVILTRLPWLKGARLWIILTLLGAGTFAVDFTRGDAMPMIGGLRLDQILDLVVALAGLAGIIIGRRLIHSAIPRQRMHLTQI